MIFVFCDDVGLPVRQHVNIHEGRFIDLATAWSFTVISVRCHSVIARGFVSTQESVSRSDGIICTKDVY